MTTAWMEFTLDAPIEGNQLLDNEAEGNHRFDCHDDTTGYGTAQTGNFWFNNTGNLSSPKALCTPGRRHDDDSR